MRPLQIILSLGIIFMLYSFIYYYFYRRFIKPLKFKGAALKYAAIGLFVFMYASFIPFFVIRFRKEPVGVISWIAWFIFGFIFTLFPLLAGKDILAGLVRLVVKIKKRWFSRRDEKNAPAGANKNENFKKNINAPAEEISRRDFLVKSNYATLGLTALFTGLGVYQARRPPRVYPVTVSIDGLPDHLAGFKIAQISDLHVGLLLDGKYLAEVVRRVNELQPDIVAITGDLVDGTVSQLREETACLADLAPVHGSYFITGNHEYYSGVEEWLVEVERLGIKVLMNSHDVIRYESKNPEKEVGKLKSKNLVIAGVPDHRAGPNAGHAYEPMKAIEGAGANDIKILLAHQPVAVDQSLKAGFHLQLSGHTHGGQFFPYNIAVSFLFRYSAGLYQHVGPNDDKMWVYVNRGTGYWGPPIRTGVPSEITLLTLEKTI